MVRRLQSDRETIMFTTANASFARTFIATLGTAVFAGICLFGATAPATAAPVDTQSFTISYKDLNLASNAGRKELDNRISFAARKVCGAGARELAKRAAEKDCISTAKADANARVFQVTASVSGN